jgi:hypothetical protein
MWRCDLTLVARTSGEQGAVTLRPTATGLLQRAHTPPLTQRGFDLAPCCSVSGIGRAVDARSGQSGRVRDSQHTAPSLVVVGDGLVGIAAVVGTRVGMNGGIGKARHLVQEGMSGSLGDGMSLGHGEVLVHDNVGFPM